MRFLAAALILLALPAQAAEDGPSFDSEVLSIKFGAFCKLVSVGEVPAPETHAQKIDLLPETPEIRWETRVIPAAPGISFGVRTQTHSDDVLSPVLIELIHPPFTSSGQNAQRYVTVLGGEGPSINAYSFDLMEEMEPGEWILSAYHNGEMLYRVPFHVVPAEELPQIAGGCEGYMGA